MKIQNIIRILAGLSFLIFLCPFFQTCSDRSLKRLNKQVETTDVNGVSTELSDSAKDSIILGKGYTESNSGITKGTETDVPQQKTNYSNESEKDHDTLNGYQMGLIIFSLMKNLR